MKEISTPGLLFFALKGPFHNFNRKMVVRSLENTQSFVYLFNIFECPKLSNFISFPILSNKLERLSVPLKILKL